MYTLLCFFLTFVFPYVLYNTLNEPKERREDWNSNKWSSSSADSLLAVHPNTGQVWNKNSSTKTLSYMCVRICVLLHVCVDTCLWAHMFVCVDTCVWACMRPLCRSVSFLSSLKVSDRRIEIGLSHRFEHTKPQNLNISVITRDKNDKYISSIVK